MGGFWNAWWQQTYQVKSIVLGSVRMLRTTLTMDIYLVSLLPHSVSKSPIGLLAYSGKQNFAMLSSFFVLEQAALVKLGPRLTKNKTVYIIFGISSTLIL